MKDEGKGTGTTETDIMLRRLTADIVSAFVGRNQVRVQEVPGLVQEVYAALAQLKQPGGVAGGRADAPAVAIGRSVARDGIVCLEDGKKFKTLKRHLRTAHDMTPEEYRAKWGLREDYPLVAPDYSGVRSTVAKKIGLGKMRQPKADRADGAASQRGKRRKRLAEAA